jgi:hypothetical protein
MADIVTPENHLLGQTVGGVFQNNGKWEYRAAHVPRFAYRNFFAIRIFVL